MKYTEIIEIMKEDLLAEKTLSSYDDYEGSDDEKADEAKFQLFHKELSKNIPKLFDNASEGKYFYETAAEEVLRSFGSASEEWIVGAFDPKKLKKTVFRGLRVKKDYFNKIVELSPKIQDVIRAAYKKAMK